MESKAIEDIMESYNNLTYKDKIHFISEILVNSDRMLLSSTVSSTSHAIYMQNHRNKLNSIQLKKLFNIQTTLEQISNQIKESYEYI